MTEERIFQLLGNITGTTFSRNVYETKLNKANVENVSKTLSSIIYESLKQRTSAKIGLNIINLLQEWCDQRQIHFNSDQNNLGHVLNCLQKEEISNCKSDQDKLLCANIYKFLIKSVENNEENVLRKNLIQEIDKKRFENLNFDFNFPSIKTYHKSPEYLQLLSIITNEQCCKTKLNTSQIYQTYERTAQLISAGYATLNLTDTKNKEELLWLIFTDISKFQQLEEPELNFVHYVWNLDALGAHTKIEFLMIKLFPFVLEKMLINLTSEYLRTEEDDGSAVLKKAKFQRIVKLCNETEVLLRVISILYELFFISNYNNRICNLITKFTNL